MKVYRSRSQAIPQLKRVGGVLPVFENGDWADTNDAETVYLCPPCSEGHGFDVYHWIVG